MNDNDRLIEDGLFDKKPDEVEEVEIKAEPDEVSFWNHVVDAVLHPVTGWSLVLLVVLLVVCWNKIHRYLDQLYERRSKQQYDAKCHKNPDWVVSNFEKMEAARRKLQDQYNSQAHHYKEKQAQKEEKKRQEKLVHLSALQGGHLLSSKSDYSPLDGDSSRGCRPTKKSKNSQGSCR